MGLISPTFYTELQDRCQYNDIFKFYLVLVCISYVNETIHAYASLDYHHNTRHLCPYVMLQFHEVKFLLQ